MSTTPTRRKTRRRSSSTGSKPSKDVNLADLLNSGVKGIPKEPPTKKATRKRESSNGYDNSNNDHKNHPTKDTWVSPCEDHDQNLRYFLYIYKCDPCDLRRNCPNKVTCPGWHHEGERRRNPAQFVYSEDPCAHTKGNGSNKWLSPSRCPAGDACQYSHTLLEQMYHPCIYKTSLCINFTHVSGNRCQWGYYCTHAHGRDDIRTPPRRMHPSGSASSVGSAGMHTHTYTYPNAMYNRTRAVSDSAMPHRTHMAQQPPPHLHGGGASMYPAYPRYDLAPTQPPAQHQHQKSWSQLVAEHTTETAATRPPQSKAPGPPQPQRSAITDGGAAPTLIPKPLPKNNGVLKQTSDGGDSASSPRSSRRNNASSESSGSNGATPKPTRRGRTNRRRSHSDPPQPFVPVLNGHRRSITGDEKSNFPSFPSSEEVGSDHSSKAHSPRSNGSHPQLEKMARSGSGSDLFGAGGSAASPAVRQSSGPSSHQSPGPSLPPAVASRNRAGSSPSIRIPPVANQLYAGAPPYYPQPTAAGNVKDLAPQPVSAASSSSGAGGTAAPTYSAPAPPQQQKGPGLMTTGTASELVGKLFHKGGQALKTVISTLKRDETGQLTGDNPPRQLLRTVTPEMPPPSAHAIDAPDPTLYLHPEEVNPAARHAPMRAPMAHNHRLGWRGDRYSGDPMEMDINHLMSAHVSPPVQQGGRYAASHQYTGYSDDRPSSQEFDHLIYELEKERRKVKALEKENSRLNAIVGSDVSRLHRLTICPNCETSENPRNHVIIPCGHLICEKCAERVQDSCVVCSSHVTGDIPIQV